MLHSGGEFHHRYHTCKHVYDIRRFVIASMPVVLNANERRSYLITHVTTAQHHSLLVALFAQYRCIWFPLHLATRQLVLTVEYKASRTRCCGWGSPSCVLTAGIAYQYPFSTALSFLGTANYLRLVLVNACRTSNLKSMYLVCTTLRSIIFTPGVKLKWHQPRRSAKPFAHKTSSASHQVLSSCCCSIPAVLAHEQQYAREILRTALVLMLLSLRRRRPASSAQDFYVKVLGFEDDSPLRPDDKLPFDGAFVRAGPTQVDHEPMTTNTYVNESLYLVRN